MQPQLHADAASPQLKRGDYQTPQATDIRSPCPVVNALANHGYIPSDGRNVSYNEVKTALSELGISHPLRTALTYGSYLEHKDNPPTGAWAFIKNPFAYFLRRFGMRNPDQQDSSGKECLNLDQLDRHNAVEHDVSLSRRDFAQGDNHTSQKDLVAEILNSSSDGKRFTTEDFAKLRKQRLEQQKRDNPDLMFGSTQEVVAYGEVGFIQTVFGHGNPKYDVPVPYVKALFEEERLPFNEGWKRRTRWTVGLIELNQQVQVVKKAIAALG